MNRKKTIKKTKNKQEHPKVPAKTEQIVPQERLIAGPGDQFLGRYCNVAMIHLTRREFVFDFIWTIQDQNLLASRIITSPQHAKRLHETLGKLIKQFEKEHGVIKE